MALSGSPVLAGYVNYCTGATFSVGTGETADASYPVVNLAQASLRKPCKVTAATTPLDITADLLAVKSDIAIVFILAYGQPTTLAWTIKVDDDSALTSPSYDSSLNTQLSTGFNVSHTPLTSYEPWWGRPVVALPLSAVSGRYVRWSFTGYALPMVLRAALVGPRLQVAGGIPAGWSGSDTIEGEPGLDLSLAKWDVDFHNVTDTEESQLFEIARKTKRSGRLVYIPQPTVPATWIREVTLCTMTDGPSKVRNPTQDYRSSVTFPLSQVRE